MNNQDIQVIQEQNFSSNNAYLKSNLYNLNNNYNNNSNLFNNSYRNNDFFNPTFALDSFDISQPAFQNNNNNFLFTLKKDTLDQIDDESLFDNNLSQMQIKFQNPVVQKCSAVLEEQIVQDQENNDLK